MPEMFNEAFGQLPLTIWNDVKTAAFAELTRGALTGVHTGMYLNLGTGIAIALTLGNDVVSGDHGAAGEIAYCMLDEHSSQGVRDGVAPFEEYVGGIWLEKRATRLLGRRVTPRDLLTSSPGPEVAAFRDDWVAKLSFHLTNALVLWDPSRLVIGGGIASSLDAIFPALSSRVRQFVPFPPEISRARFGGEAGVIGAIELARLKAETRPSEIPDL